MPALLRPSGPVDGITPSPRSQSPGPLGVWLVFCGDQDCSANFSCPGSAEEAAFVLQLGRAAASHAQPSRPFNVEKLTMIHSIARLGVTGAVAAIACWSAIIAEGATKFYVGPASGVSANWNNAANWSATSGGAGGAGVPASGDDVRITDSDGVSRTVTYDYTGSPVTLEDFIVDLTGGAANATNTLSMSANNLTVNTEEAVGFNRSGTFNQTGGSNTITAGYLDLGAGTGSIGTYTLSNSGSLTVSADESIGDSGKGIFVQSGGTNTINYFELDIGYHAGSTGNYSLNGGMLSAPSVYVGGSASGSGGTGVLTVSGTGVLNVPGSLVVYNTAGSELNLNGGTINAGGEIILNGGRINWTTGTFNIAYDVEIDTIDGGPFPGNSLTLASGMVLSCGGFEIVGAQGTGSITQSGGSNTITSSELDLGEFAGSTGNYSLTGGTLSAPNAYVGGSASGPGGTGVLTVSGTGSATVTGTLKVYNTAGTLLTLSGGTINAGSLNLSGNPALFNWTGGTLNLTNSSVELDTSASAWNGFSSLTLNSGMALVVSGDETIGGSGTGSLTESGGNNTIHGGEALTLGGANGSTGTYTLSGGTLSSFGSEYVGYGGTGNFNQSGGTNEIYPYSLYIGYGTNSNGVYTLSGSGSLITSGNESVGAFGTGSLNQSGGSNSMIEGGILYIAQYGGSSGSYALSGGTLSAANIYVGGSDAGPGGTGVLTVSGSGDLNAPAASITVYNTPGSGFKVNGGTVSAAALNLMGTYTQTAGSATYGHITGGGQMAVSGGQVILTDDSTGHLASVNVSGTTTLGFDIGYTSASQIVADTATFNAAPTIAFTLSGYPEGGTVFTLLSATHLNDNGNLGSLPTQAVIIGRDTLTPSLTGGSGAAGAIIVTITGGPANLTWIGSNTGGAWDTQTTHNWNNHGNEALTPDVFYAGDHVTFDDTAANFVVDLYSGNVIANSVTFNNSLHAYTVNGVNGIAGATGVTFSGSNSVTLNNSNSYTGTTTISGGGIVSIAGSIASPTINVTHGTLQLAADYALTGTPVVTLGNGATTGTLDLGGFTNTVGGLSGGAGNLVTNTSSGSATLNFAGGSSTFGGVIQDGGSGGQVALNITSGSLTLSGTNTYSGGTMINGGTLAVNGSILGDVSVNYGGTLAGHGSVAGMATVSYGGFLSPGNGPTGTGKIALGALTLSSGSQTNIKLAGTTPGSQYDQVQVTGSASLAGTLSVSLINGFAPQANETFDILTGSTPSGMFDTLQLPSLTGALSWDTSQLDTNGVLSVAATYLPGDFNRDGHVDAADILPMMAALANLHGYEQTNGLTNSQLLAIGDINGDGVVNNADLQALLDLLQSGGGSADPVPEPTSLVLLAAGSLMLMLCRGRALVASTSHNCQNGRCA